MIDDKTKKPASVTFHMEGCEEGGLLTGKLQLSMRIVATVDSRETIEKVKAKFLNGFTIHTVEDFKGTMIKVLQEDNTNHEQRIRELEIQLMNERKAHMALKEKIKDDNATLNFFKKRA